MSRRIVRTLANIHRADLAPVTTNRAALSSSSSLSAFLDRDLVKRIRVLATLSSDSTSIL